MKTIDSASPLQGGYDWIHLGRTLRFYRYAPQIPSDEIVDTFKDSLKDIIQSKLEEALIRCEELKAVRDKKLEIVSTKTKTGSFDRYFWSSIVFHEFSEYFVIQKWLRYWLNIWYKISPQSLPQRTTSRNSIDELAIQQARGVSLEKLYEGRLRRSGARLVGLCPFHEERTPSFFIFPDNHFHCYGCQAHGDSIDFVMRARGLSFIEAVKYLL